MSVGLFSWIILVICLANPERYRHNAEKHRTSSLNADSQKTFKKVIYKNIYIHICSRAPRIRPDLISELHMPAVFIAYVIHMTTWKKLQRLSRSANSNGCHKAIDDFLPGRSWKKDSEEIIFVWCAHLNFCAVSCGSIKILSRQGGGTKSRFCSCLLKRFYVNQRSKSLWPLLGPAGYVKWQQLKKRKKKTLLSLGKPQLYIEGFRFVGGCGHVWGGSKNKVQNNPPPPHSVCFLKLKEVAH